MLVAINAGMTVLVHLVLKVSRICHASGKNVPQPILSKLRVAKILNNVEEHFEKPRLLMNPVTKPLNSHKISYRSGPGQVVVVLE